ncbi:hypothetical protein B0H16DRAFT_299571 [Mycena metata]|uniref:Glycosyltransferase 61 catalytic domain-containing protein n=1 Tax=Mycena metata TaxID=1033252 RepID=A0AAD7KH14_9AGAR|nr:hypothetical protein B0H16DRAFT_299571 [Mycena metata]
MVIRHTRRDIILLLVGAVSMRLFTSFFHSSAPLDIHPETDNHSPPTQKVHHTTTVIEALTTTVTVTLKSEPTSHNALDLAMQQLPPTSLVAHAPGWTLFKNLYMSAGTLYIVTDTPSEYPKIPLMASNPLPAENTPQNIALREPTAYNMAFITPAQAKRRWGDDAGQNRVFTADGNTVLVNEPQQFLRHYYHLVAELMFGVQAFWHGAFSKPSFDVDREYVRGPHPAPPPIDRVMFARSSADGWRDGPGFNAYFMRAAFPATTIEVEEDWEDRVEITETGDRAFHFPQLLLTDRSASHRGAVCGSQTQRIAAEAVEYMRKRGQLVGIRVGGWWEPVRQKVLRFAGADASFDAVFSREAGGESTQLPMPSKIVITYTSRQSAGNRKLIPESHEGLVNALRELVQRKGPNWKLNVIEAEKLTRDTQLQIIARTTILLGVHGNGLTHLVMMPPTRLSTVIEMFYPGGFAHDYQWTSRALGMKHFAVWNDTYRSEGVGEGKPRVNYPDGFQSNRIPVDGPTVAQAD